MEIKLTNQFTKELNARGYCTSATLRYMVSGINDIGGSGPDSALAAVFGTAPLLVGAARRQRINLAECCGHGVYIVDAEYECNRTSPRQRQEERRAGDQDWIFSSIGGREHIICGMELISTSSGTDGITPPDPGVLINWNGRFGDAFDVAGIDIITASMRESCLMTITADELTTRFCRRIGELTGKVNSSTFHGWSKHEVLFVGASTGIAYYNDENDKLIDVMYDFAIRPGEGWDYHWDITLADPLSRSVSVMGKYVTRVYDEGDFHDLGL